MKLWLISQEERNGYDTFDSAVVAAESEEVARGIHPQLTWGTGKPEWARPHGTWATSPENVTAKLIGEAAEGTELGVILASFNAG